MVSDALTLTPSAPGAGVCPVTLGALSVTQSLAAPGVGVFWR